MNKQTLSVLIVTSLILGSLLIISSKLIKEKSVVIAAPPTEAKSFIFPVGGHNASGYYDAQPFGKNNHLGSDWNATSGGNSDLGAEIKAVANGYVFFSKDVKGGWGNVIRIIHYTNKGRVESLYAHCLDRKVKSGDYVSKGQVIGTIGTANGKYTAHLHFEIRDVVGMDLGPGYSWNTMGYLDPTKYIKDNY